MTKISAAVLHLRVGEILAKIRYTGERFIVERRGVPVAAIVSVDDLTKLGAEQTERQFTKAQCLAALAQADAVRRAILEERHGVPLPDSTTFLNELREERDHELAHLH
jgi:antitoxin (DNA-binding transcriptional repressor) of toxin-antitoxin stability system